MASLYLKVYKKMPSGRLIDGEEDYTKECKIDDELYPELLGLIGDTMIVVHEDEDSDEEIQYQCIPDSAMPIVISFLKAKIKEFIESESTDINFPDKDIDFILKLNNLTKMFEMLYIKMNNLAGNDLAILQLE
ncbi:hypothetical protein KX75_20560 [Salmonella enterica subsp. enterica]|nr:hypothetical protein [Salmonella enterica subsp. enterica serovar Mikawasima]EDN7229260.1 hypothetical protein [Salmonella enterica subsp. enterica serovar Mikawasima]